MVISRQNSDEPPLVTVGFNNPDRPQLGVETLTHAELIKRLPQKGRVRLHRPDFYQLTLVTNGQGTAMVDFIDYPCSAGTLLHVRPGQVQRIPRPLPDAPGTLDAVIVLFTVAFLPRLDRIAPLLSNLPGTAVWATPESERPGITSAVNDLAVEYRRAVEEGDAAGATIDLIQQLLGALLLRITRLPHPDGPDAAGGRSDDAYRRFQHELERSFATTRNAADYAARNGYSPRTLNRACQAATGRTAKALIDARVALEAKRLLAHTSLPVTVISRRLGFTEPTNFGKFFTRETGSTPGEFRTQGHA